MASTRKVCSISRCQRCVDAVCTCCQEHLCNHHLKEHSDLLSAKLISLSEQINPLLKQLNDFTSPQPAFLTKLDKWRAKAHQLVDDFCDKKKREFPKLIDKERNKQKIELDRLRDRINASMKEQRATQEHIDSIGESIRLLQKQINQFQSAEFIFSPLIIDDQLVTINQTTSISDALLPLSFPCQTIELKVNWSSIAANDDHLLVGLGDKICLLNRQLTVSKEILWTDTDVLDMFWSSTLAQFILLAGGNIYTLDEKSMNVNQYSTARNNNITSWYCGTCLNDSLFLAPCHWGSSVYQYTLPPSIQLIDEYKPPFPCTEEEFIWDLSSNGCALGLVIINRHNEVRLDLCSSTTFERLWSVQLGCTSNRYRCCSLNNDQWLVNNPNKSELFHISADGQLVKKVKYKTFLPLHAVQLQNNVIAMLTTKGINIHQLS